MFKLNRLAVCLLTALSVTPALADVSRVDGTATTVVVDGNQVQESIDFSVTSGVLTISTASGNMTLGPADGGGPVDPPEPGVLSIDSFTVNGQQSVTVNINQVFTVAWATTDAVSCVTGGGNRNWRETSIGTGGSVNASLDQFREWSLRITCADAAGNEVTETRTVIVSADTDPGTNTDTCQKTVAERPLFNGQSRAVNWFSELGSVFPGPTVNNNTATRIPRNGYSAIEFNTGSEPAAGGFSLSSSSSVFFPLLAISPCEGDFDVPDSCRNYISVSQSFAFSTEVVPGRCKLEPNTTYYLNLTYGSQDFSQIGSPTPSCPSSLCPALNMQYDRSTN
jgi:hypothetical protein